MPKDYSVPLKVGGWDVEFQSVAACIEETIVRLFDCKVPVDVVSRAAYLSLSLAEAEEQLKLLTHAMAAHGVAFSEDQ